MSLRIISRLVTAGGKYQIDIDAKDFRIQPVLRVDFTGRIEVPKLDVGDFVVVRILKDPVSNNVRAVALKSTDPDPAPGLSRIVSVFGTYNYADDPKNWVPIPITFMQVGRDIWTGSDASVEPNWTLRSYPNWDPKAISHWIPTDYAEMGVFRVEVGQAVESATGYVQANIAAASNGFCSREVKGHSPWIQNNRYVIDSGLQVPLLDRYIYCCGFNAKVGILCAGYRLKG